MKKDIYIFSGLGADERAFKHYEFLGFSTTFIKWHTPEYKETIENYATRILTQITTSNPTLIGLSFGGIMAIGVAKQIQTERLILIASVKTKNEIPFYFRFAGRFSLHKLIPAPFLKDSNLVMEWFFGATLKSEKELLSQIIIDTDRIFLKWAIDKLVCWKNITKLKNITHIHGTSDRILPIRYVHCDIKIKNGGHLMTINKAEEVTSILSQILKSKPTPTN